MPLLEEFLVSGGLPQEIRDASNFDLFGGWNEGADTLQPQSGSTSSGGGGGGEAFAPPLPLLPEVVVTPPPPPKPSTPIRVPPVVVTTPLSTLLTGIGLLFLPQPTGPREHDELDPGDVMQRPPPRGTPPGGTDPIMPPNWDDLSDPGPPDKPVSQPIIGVDRPEEVPLLPEFVVQPPIPEVPFFMEPGFDLDTYLNPELRPGARPGPSPAPWGAPRLDPDFESPGTVLSPSRPSLPLPSRPPAPDVLGTPLPIGIGLPVGDPVAEPGLPDRALPGTPGPARPRPVVPPADDLDPFFQPFSPVFPDPEPIEAGSCDCSKPKVDQKERKKPTPRAVCYRGTYRQLSKGIIYKRLEQIPCAQGGAAAAKPKQKAPPGLGIVATRDRSPLDVVRDILDVGAQVDDLLRDTGWNSTPKRNANRRPKTAPGRLPRNPVLTTPF